jgi:hypothetical protein
MKKSIKISLSILGIVVAAPLAAFGAIWFLVTQPLFFLKMTGSDQVVDPARLEAHVRVLSETCSPRDYTHPENLDRAAQYIYSQFERAGGRVVEQPYQVDGIIYKNILVQFGPPTGERLVIGAHYDTYKPYPSANDDASGVAALIELAYLLGDLDLSQTVELVAFTLEEPPFYNSEEMGSYVHAASLQEQGIPVELMITLDEIGYYSDEPGSQSLPIPPWLKGGYSSTANFIAILGPLETGFHARTLKAAMTRAADLPVVSFTVPVGLERRVLMGDHRNYWEAGYPAVIITDTSFLRSDLKHSAFDTAETLDYQRIAKAV